MTLFRIKKKNINIFSIFIGKFREIRSSWNNDIEKGFMSARHKARKSQTEQKGQTENMSFSILF